MTLHGYSVPRTPEGRSSLVPYPPWHYVGAFLVVDYWTDPEQAVAFLPEGIDPHPDPGRCAFVAADWQSCSETGDELVDPSRSQYKEVFVVVNGLLEGDEVTVCSYIWVDRDFALTRGWIQGFPKKLGSIWITRSFGLGGPADPGMEAGARFGATCAAYERRVAEATVTLEHPSAGGPFHNAPPIVNVRHFPRLAAGRHDDPAVHELVRSIEGIGRPVLLTLGDQSPPIFAPVVRKLAEALPRAKVHTFAGAGHIPHVTHPDAYVEAIGSFVRKNSA
jgi:acetoacetate decarboxylase